jgi:hypothetical protein
MFLLTYQKNVNIFLYIIANLVGNINILKLNIETYHVNRDSVEGPATTTVGGEGRMGTPSHGQASYDLSYQVQCDLRQ